MSPKSFNKEANDLLARATPIVEAEVFSNITCQGEDFGMTSKEGLRYVIRAWE